MTTDNPRDADPLIRMSEAYALEEKVQAKQPKDREEADRIRREIEEEKSDAN